MGTMKKLIALVFLIGFFTQITASNLSWSAPSTLSSSMVNASDPQVIVDSNGNATAAWVQNGHIQAAFQPVNGSWGSASSISNSGASSPRLGVDSSGNVTAVWVANGIIQVSTRPLNGSWGFASSIS